MSSNHFYAILQDLIIKQCYFEYQKLASSIVKLKITKRNSVVIISNTTFISNDNNYVDVDHILSTTVLFIDIECCFNKEMDKSIKLVHGSSLDAEIQAFGCNMDNTKTEASKILILQEH